MLGCSKMKYISKDYEGPVNTCGCPIRDLPPPMPDKLPFEPKDENVKLMEN